MSLVFWLLVVVGFAVWLDIKGRDDEE